MRRRLHRLGLLIENRGRSRCGLVAFFERNTKLLRSEMESILRKLLEPR